MVRPERPVKSCKEGALLNCRILPSSSRNAVVEVTDAVVRIKITSPPLEGKANKTLAAFLAKMFKISKNRVKIVSGLSAKQKTLLMVGLESEKVLTILRKKT